MNQPKDKMQIEALRNDDETVFNNIFNHFTNKLTMFIASFIHSEQDARELTQDVLYALWSRRKALDLNLNIKSYLYASAKNAALDFIKKKKHHQDYVRHERYVNNDAAESIEDLYSVKEIETIVEKTLERLPRQCRIIYRMSRNKGMSNDEIAKKLHITKKTVEVQIYKALKALKRAFFIYLEYCI